MLRVESTFGIEKARSIDTITSPKPRDACTYVKHYSRALRTKHIRERRIDAQHLSVAALPLERIPCAHAGKLEADQ